MGGAARDVYDVEARTFDEKYGDMVSRFDYDRVVKAPPTDPFQLAQETIALAGQIASSRSVSVVMSFQELSEYSLLHRTLQDVCEELEYKAQRVDKSYLLKPIDKQIVDSLRRCLCNCRHHRAQANLYYELGFAHGLGKQVVIVAKEGTKPPFDISQWNVIFWVN